MLAYLFDWLNLLARWTHLIFGIAWIGASFYFVWLDNHLVPPEDPELDRKGVGGEVWSVHGGGFYNALKYRVAPPTLPPDLHWFYWEAYSTWLSGMFLLSITYYANAEVYMIDPNVAKITPLVAIAVGLGSLIGGWLIYDRLCESALAKKPQALSAILFVLLAGAAYGLCHTLSGRGAFIQFGAMLGTIMVANVFFVIIPGQRELVAAKQAGRTPDPTPGMRAKQRSVHNTYFTLPVLFMMISNHYAMTTGASYNWLVLIALTFAGATIRVYFVARHKAGNSASPWPLVAGVGTLVALMVFLRPDVGATPVGAASGAGTTIESPAQQAARISALVTQRCVPCHSATPTQPGFAAPPNGVILDSLDRIMVQREKMRVQLASHAMPIGNLTQMTEGERASLLAWIDAGAPH